MRRSSPAVRSGSDRTGLYQEITCKIIAELEAGRLPWVQPWGTSAMPAPLAMPRNASTGRRYSGINVLILWGAVVQHGFSGQNWLTFRQALALGGHVGRGERGIAVVFADRFAPDAERERARERGDDPRTVPFLKRFTVFNTDQCEGLPEEVTTAAPPAPEGLILPAVEALIRASGADLRIGGGRAYYDVIGDFVRVPPPQAYFAPVNWHRTALHEMAHWSGSRTRLNRDLSGSFGSKSYAKEELVAEMTAAFACATLGIVPTVRHADYVASSTSRAERIEKTGNLSDAEIEIVPFDGAQVRVAAAAFDLYGKGIDPKARLNLSDCAAYALAKIMNAPLLFKGDDFTQADLQRCL